MKKLIVVFVSILIFSTSAYAHSMGGMMGQEGGMQHQGMMMGSMMGQKGDMQQCMSHMKDMMQMMMDMMDMQKKTLMGVRPDDKKKMMMQIDKMMENMKKMMSDMEKMNSMQMKDMNGSPSAEPPKEEQKEEVPLQEEAPKNDQHQH